jgi:hypothetical protein
MNKAIAATSAKKPSVEPTEAAITVVVGMVFEEALSDGDVNPASLAADAAMRSYMHIGSEGTVFDMAHRTSGLLVSQLKTC